MRIGERKVKDDSTNPNRAEGIHSVMTAKTYRGVANSFAVYLKGQGIRNIYDIAKSNVGGYIQSRLELSTYTLSKDLAAINKLLDTRYTLQNFGVPNRSYQEITNNRGLASRDTSNALRNKQQLAFVMATGIRRASIDTITPSHAIRDSNGLVIGFHVTEKGGRERNCVVLTAERERITALINSHIETLGNLKPLFSKIDSNANPHYCRREYAQALYRDLFNFHLLNFDYYNGMRDSFINQSKLEYAVSRYNNLLVSGYKRDLLAEVSQNLGHNRVDVVIYHYLK